MTAVPNKAAPKDPRKFVTPLVRLSFPKLFVKHELFPGSGKHGFDTTLLIPPDAIKPFLVARDAAIEGKWGSKKPAGLRVTLHRCEEKPDRAGYQPGWFFVSVSSDSPVPVVNAQRVPITEPSKVYAGVWAHVALNAFAFQNATGSGVSFGLRAVQIVKDGERIDGRSAPANPDETFEALELEEDSDGEVIPFDPLG